MEVTRLVATLVCLAVGTLGGSLVPSVIARLPDPEPEPEEPPVSYLDLADTPHLGWRSAATGGAAGLVIGLALGWSWLLAVWLPLVPVGVALGFVDWRTRLLPRPLVLAATGYVVCAVGAFALINSDLDLAIRAGSGLLLARTLFWVLWWVHSAGMGFGDVRLAALLGAALAAVGWPEFAVGLYAGALVFGVPALLLALWRRSRTELKVPRPYGPFMLVGALIGLLVGEPLAALIVG